MTALRRSLKGDRGQFNLFNLPQFVPPAPLPPTTSAIEMTLNETETAREHADKMSSS